MKFIFSPRHHLSARLLVALAAMLVPLLILGAGTYFSFRLLSSSLNEVVERALGEMAPLTELQLLLQETRIALHHAIHEDDGHGASERIAELIKSTDKAFESGSELPFGDPEKIGKFQAALREWKLGRQRIGQILPSPEGIRLSPQPLMAFDEHVRQAILLLKEVHVLSENEILEQLSAVEATKRNISKLNSVLFLIGIIMVLGIGLLLARSILRPLRQLESGVRRFTSGDFSYRIASHREDELGGLTQSFNTMAQELARERLALQELSIRDPLTGLFNHREFYRILTEELERAHRYLHPLSLLMLDLDFFKKVNDTYGHQAGDHALTTVSGIIVRQLRRVDGIARYGGEEFAIILPETLGTEAIIIAERIRQAVAARPVSISGTEEITLTVSIGLAVYPSDAETADDLVNMADKALYRAKNEGRNRVCRPPAAGRGEGGDTGLSESLNP